MNFSSVRPLESRPAAKQGAHLARAASRPLATQAQQSLSGDASFRWNATAGSPNRIQALEADGFQVGTSDQVNKSGETYHYIAFKDGGP